MDRLGDMRLLVAVMDASGLAAGGRMLGLSPPSVSARIAALEQHIGARLLNRTTRSIALTDEGRVYVEAARRILAEVDELDVRLTEGKDRLAGHLRIAAPFDLGRNRLAPVLNAFMAQNPAISVELVLSDGFIDLVGNRIDLALRLGDLPDSTLVVRRIGPTRRIVCASPDYLTRHGVPETPSDLLDHNCLTMVFGDRPDNRWRFSVEGRDSIVAVVGNRQSNDGELVRKWAIGGFGIARKSSWDIEADLAAGRLREVLSAFAPPATSLQIAYPPTRELPRRTRALIDFIAARFDDGAYPAAT